MIRNLLAKLNRSEVNIDEILHQIENVRKKTSILNLCASSTGSSWLGVKNAAYSLFPENTVELPQHYSETKLSNDQINKIGSTIGLLNFDQLIFNGFNIYFLTIIRNVLKSNPKCRIGVIHHGFFAEISSESPIFNIYEAILEGINLGYIHKIGFLKKGNSDVFNHFFHLEKFEIININPSRIEVEKIQKSIGILTNANFRKNTVTQGIAALCCKEFKVIVSSKSSLEPFDKNNKLVELGHLNHLDFLRQMAQNTINSHVTFSEASGGQVFTESLAMGVPCLTSLTHGYLDDNEYLRKSLVVDRFDDAWAIHEKMCEAIDQRQLLSKFCIEHSEQMNQKAKELLQKFIG